MDRPDPFPGCLLSWGFAPSGRHGTPYTVPGSGLIVSPHAGRRALHATPTAIQAPSATLRPWILGPRAGAAANRCSTGHLVRSSALVFSQSVAPLKGRPPWSNGGANALNKMEKRSRKGGPLALQGLASPQAHSATASPQCETMCDGKRDAHPHRGLLVDDGRNPRLGRHLGPGNGRDIGWEREFRSPVPVLSTLHPHGSPEGPRKGSVKAARQPRDQRNSSRSSP